MPVNRSNLRTAKRNRSLPPTHRRSLRQGNRRRVRASRNLGPVSQGARTAMRLENRSHRARADRLPAGAVPNQSLGAASRIRRRAARDRSPATNRDPSRRTVRRRGVDRPVRGKRNVPVPVDRAAVLRRPPTSRRLARAAAPMRKATRAATRVAAAKRVRGRVRGRPAPADRGPVRQR